MKPAGSCSDLWVKGSAARSSYCSFNDSSNDFSRTNLVWLAWSIKLIRIAFIWILCCSFSYLFICWSEFVRFPPYIYLMLNASEICVSSLNRGHTNLLYIVPILVYMLPKWEQNTSCVLKISLISWSTNATFYCFSVCYGSFFGHSFTLISVAFGWEGNRYTCYSVIPIKVSV